MKHQTVLARVALLLTMVSWTCGYIPIPQNISQIMDDLLVGYDRRIRPNYGEKPVDITLNNYILDVYDIDELKHEFSVILYFRQSWIDPRLTFRPSPGVEYINFDAENYKKLWMPDTFIVNEKKSLVHSFQTSNEFTRVAPDGLILRSTRATITASCKMNLKWFPFDTHTCTLEFESYGSTASEFTYKWKPKGSGFSQEVSSVNFDIVNVKTTAMSFSLSTGNYSRAAMEFYLRRVPTRYLQDIYFPAFILPLVAFITLSTGSPQMRVQLSVLCMVGIVIFQTLTAVGMPKVSYQTALDFYVFNSSFLIFNVVIVNFLMYHFLKPKQSQGITLLPMNGTQDESKQTQSTSEAGEDFNVGRPNISNKCQTIVFGLCEKSKWTMPCFFVVFNVLYWMVVLISSNTFPEDFLITEDHS